MLKVQNECTITVTGEDADTLRNMCEMVRRYLADKSGEWTDGERNEVKSFITHIFDSQGDREAEWE